MRVRGAHRHAARPLSIEAGPNAKQLRVKQLSEVGDSGRAQRGRVTSAPSDARVSLRGETRALRRQRRDRDGERRSQTYPIAFSASYRRSGDDGKSVPPPSVRNDRPGNFTAQARCIVASHAVGIVYPYPQAMATQS